MKYLTILGFLFCSLYSFGQIDNLDSKFSQLSNQAESMEFLVDLFTDYNQNPSKFTTTKSFNSLIVEGILNKKLLLDVEAEGWLRIYLSATDESIRSTYEANLLTKL
jgi:hypothetical protein